MRSASASNTAVLLLTGDITDHGEAAEWNAAAEILSPLREAKLPILLAPGNHDLSFAYARKEQFYARVAEHGFGKPGLYQYLYGRRLLDYLRFQNSLCPGIVLADGQVLSELTTGMFALLDAERDLFRRVASAGRLDETVLNTYLDDLMARGLMHGSRRDGYAIILRGDARHHIGGFNLVQCEIAEGFVGLSVADKIFPMRYLDPENDAEIFMLNSVVVDDSLIASASGELAEAQAERFGGMVAASTARNIVVLIHHAPFRWADEPQPTFLGAGFASLEQSCHVQQLRQTVYRTSGGRARQGQERRILLRPSPRRAREENDARHVAWGFDFRGRVARRVRRGDIGAGPYATGDRGEADCQRMNGSLLRGDPPGPDAAVLRVIAGWAGQGAQPPPTSRSTSGHSSLVMG